MFFRPAGGNGAAYTSKFRAYRNAQQSIPASTQTKVQFNTEDYDGESEYDKDTNHRFVAKETGKYHLGANVDVESVVDGKSISMLLKLNGTTTICTNQIKVGNSGVSTGHPECDIDLTAEDYVEVFAYHTDTVARNTGTIGGCQFFGHRIG